MAGWDPGGSVGMAQPPGTSGGGSEGGRRPRHHTLGLEGQERTPAHSPVRPPSGPTATPSVRVHGRAVGPWLHSSVTPAARSRAEGEESRSPRSAQAEGWRWPPLHLRVPSFPCRRSRRTCVAARWRPGTPPATAGCSASGWPPPTAARPCPASPAGAGAAISGRTLNGSPGPASPARPWFRARLPGFKSQLCFSTAEQPRASLGPSFLRSERGS